MLDDVVIPSGVFGPLTVRVDPAKAEELLQLAAQAAVYVTNARGAGTLRAYRSAWKLYCAWCDDLGFPPLNSDPRVVSLYTVKASERLAISTLRVHLAAIATAHRLAGQPIDLKHPSIALVLDGMARSQAKRPKRVASPLAVDALAELVRRQPDTPLGVRNRALLLIGFFAALRRSELVALDIGDAVDMPGKGLKIILRRSKTDQYGDGQEIGICAAETPSLCALTAWRAWMALRYDAGLDRPLFTAVRKNGAVTERRLSDKAVERLLKDGARALKLPDAIRYTGHSLRAGLATAAAEEDAQLHDIMRQTRHRSVEVVRRYLRSRDLWRNNVTEKVVKAAVHRDE